MCSSKSPDHSNPEPGQKIVQQVQADDSLVFGADAALIDKDAFLISPQIIGFHFFCLIGRFPDEAFFDVPIPLNGVSRRAERRRRVGDPAIFQAEHAREGYEGNGLRLPAAYLCIRIALQALPGQQDLRDQLAVGQAKMFAAKEYLVNISNALLFL